MARIPLDPPPLREAITSRAWLEWFRRLYERTSGTAQILWDQVIKSGSNLTEIETRNHNDLQTKQGGDGTDYYHLGASEYSLIQDLENDAIQHPEILMDENYNILYSDKYNVLTSIDRT